MSFDILGLGTIALDNVLYVDRFPEPDTKTRASSRRQQLGGITATALIAASRLGCRCAYAGTLGESESTTKALRILEGEGVNAEHVKFEGEGGPVETTVIVDQSSQTRTIISDLTGTLGASEDHPPDELIQSSKILFVDHYGVEGMTRAAKIARSSGVSVVADLERSEWPGFDVLLSLVDHLILSREVSARITGCAGVAEMVSGMWQEDREIVVVTDGADGCWYRSRESEEVKHRPAFEVDAIDTTGCGDVFHGAYCWALLQNLPIDERIRFASAAAAVKATRLGGSPAAPTIEEVSTLLSQD